MITQIETVETAAQRDTLRALLNEYERALPPRLRHGVINDAAFDALIAPPARAYVATVDGTAQGCVLLAHFDERTCVVQRLFVRESARGSGAGRALMLHLIERARTAGYRRVALDTDGDELRAAYGLYESLGFVPCEPFMEVGYDGADFMEMLL